MMVVSSAFIFFLRPLRFISLTFYSIRPADFAIVHVHLSEPFLHGRIENEFLFLEL